MSGGCSGIDGLYYPGETIIRRNCVYSGLKFDIMFFLCINFTDCKFGYHHTTANICQQDGNVGIKTTLMDRLSCQPDEELQGLLCYKRCSDGYSKVGLNICSPAGGPGIKTNLFDRQYCDGGTTLAAGLCATPCKPGFHSVGASICSVDCPPGMMDFGLGCTKRIYSRGVGDPDLKINIKDSTTRGAGVPPKGVKITAKTRTVPFSSKSN